MSTATSQQPSTSAGSTATSQQQPATIHIREVYHPRGLLPHEIQLEIIHDTRQAPRTPTLTTCSCLTRASAAFPSLLRRATRTVAPMLVVAALAPLACTRPVCVPPHDQGEGLRKSGRAAKRGWSQEGEILDMLAINPGFYCFLHCDAAGDLPTAWCKWCLG